MALEVSGVGRCGQHGSASTASTEKSSSYRGHSDRGGGGDEHAESCCGGQNKENVDLQSAFRQFREKRKVGRAHTDT
ncbi:unnamed protein product [Lampetra planeri]